MKFLRRCMSVALVTLIILLPFGITANAATVSEMQNKVLSVADNEVGYTGSSSYSKYGEWYGYLGKYNMINNLSLPSWLAKEIE